MTPDSEAPAAGDEEQEQSGDGRDKAWMRMYSITADQLAGQIYRTGTPQITPGGGGGGGAWGIY